MNLILFRHGTAHPPSGGNDRDRTLTASGRSALATAAHVWARLLPTPDLYITSPYRRARESTEILAQNLGHARIEVSTSVTPDGDPSVFLDTLPEAATLVIVSHMPFVGELAGQLAAGSDQALIPFSTGMGLWLELHALCAASAHVVAAISTKAAAALNE